MEVSTMGIISFCITLFLMFTTRAIYSRWRKMDHDRAVEQLGDVRGERSTQEIHSRENRLLIWWIMCLGTACTALGSFFVTLRAFGLLK